MAYTGQLAAADSKLANIEPGGVAPYGLSLRFPLLQFEIDWTDDPTTAPAEVNYIPLANRVRSFSTRRGRPTQFERVEAGTATVVLDNRDGYFNWNQTNRLLLRRARIGGYWDHDTFPILNGYIEAFHYEYPGTDKDAVCVLTISEGQKVLAMQQFATSFERNVETVSSRLDATFGAAGVLAQVRDVSSATIDNAHTLAPVRVIEGGASTQSRSCTVADGDATVTLASGTTDGLAAGMAVTGAGIPAGTTIASITDSTHLEMSANAVLSVDVRVESTPGSTVLTGSVDSVSVGMEVGPETNTNGEQIYGSASPWKATVTANQGGSVTITPATRAVTFWDGGDPPGSVNTTFTASTSQTLNFPLTYLQVSGILEHVRQIEATERGLYVVLKDGTHQYQGLDWRTGQSSALTFGENSGSGEVPYAETSVIYDDTNVVNEYVLRNVVNETQTTISDATSQARYFKRSETIEQIWQTNYTNLPTSQRAFEPIARLEGLTVQPLRDPTLWRSLLGLEISQLVTVKRRAMGGSDIFTTGSDQFIEGIEHEANPQDWRIRYITSPR